MLTAIANKARGIDPATKRGFSWGPWHLSNLAGIVYYCTYHLEFLDEG